MQAERIKRPYGSGSIIERDGRYYGSWRSNGRRVMRLLGPVAGKSGDGLTRTQAEAKLREQMASVQVEPAKPTSNGRTIKDLGDAYIEHARTHKGLKEATTLKDYAATVRLHFVPFFGSKPVDHITARDIERFVAQLRTKRGQGRRGGQPLAPKSVDNYVRTLTALLNFAVRKKWLPVSPMTAADLPRLRAADRPIDELTFLEPMEVARLVLSARPGDYQTLDRALYTLAAYTGLRQGELRGLKWAHVDFDASIVHVLSGITRGAESSPKGRRRRSVPLAPTAAQTLVELRASSDWLGAEDYVFACPSTGRPMNRADLMERYRDALEAAQIPRTFSFHDLRHTFGTTLARAGRPVGDIQAWMGHADLATTMIYMHHAPRARDAALIDSAFTFEPEMGQAA
jgi:integrase